MSHCPGTRCLTFEIKTAQQTLYTSHVHFLIKGQSDKSPLVTRKIHHTEKERRFTTPAQLPLFPVLRTKSNYIEFVILLAS